MMWSCKHMYQRNKYIIILTIQNGYGFVHWQISLAKIMLPNDQEEEKNCDLDNKVRLGLNPLPPKKM